MNSPVEKRNSSKAHVFKKQMYSGYSLVNSRNMLAPLKGLLRILGKILEIIVKLGEKLGSN